MFNSVAKGLILLGVFLFSCRFAIAESSASSTNDFSGENVGSESSQSEDVSDRGIRKPVITVIDINKDHSADVKQAPSQPSEPVRQPIPPPIPPPVVRKQPSPPPEEIATKSESAKTELVELNGSTSAEPVPLYSAPNGTTLIGGLGRGQIVSVSPAAGSKASGWRQIQIDGSESIWFKYDAKTMKTLNVSRGIAFKLKPSAQKQAQPLYRSPGLWKPEDCERDPTVCVAKLKAETTVRVLRAQLRHVDSQQNRLWLNFYEVTEAHSDPHHEAARGWIPASLAMDAALPQEEVAAPVAVASPVPVELPHTADIDADEEPQPTPLESGLFLFESNATIKGRKKKLVEDARVPDLGKEHLTSISGLTLRFNAGTGYDYITVNQPFAGPEYALQAVRASADASAFLFLDLQLKLNIDFDFPISSTDKSRPVQGYYFDAQEWLTYTTNWKVNEGIVKLGLGAYYIGLGTGQPLGGLPGLVGFQVKALIDGKRFTTGLRYAPVAQDLAIDPKNRILGLEVGYKFGDEDDEQPVQLKLKYDDIYFKNPATTDSTTLRVLGLGLTIPIKF